MQAIIELVAAVVVWMAVATFNHLGIEVDLSRPEPERVIQRESEPARKALVHETPCPEEVGPAAAAAAKTA